tara:strand:- start:14168 stop:14605 length:438 start_codon:yes stop_codon:yes gene_type:complete
MNSKTLVQTIHRSIPLSQTLGFHIAQLSESAIEVSAPLEPNINIHNAAFAGSLYSVAALTAWAMVTHLVTEAALQADVVIGKAEIIYNRPITEAIFCRSEVASAAAEEFLTELRQSGKTKINLVVEIGNHSEASLRAVVFATGVS